VAASVPALNAILPLRRPPTGFAAYHASNYTIVSNFVQNKMKENEKK
jgi:hypothetical protein